MEIGEWGCVLAWCLVLFLLGDVVRSPWCFSVFCGLGVMMEFIDDGGLPLVGVPVFMVMA